jgi:hypothetical protein
VGHEEGKEKASTLKKKKFLISAVDCALIDGSVCARQKQLKAGWRLKGKNDVKELSNDSILRPFLATSRPIKVKGHFGVVKEGDNSVM